MKIDRAGYPFIAAALLPAAGAVILALVIAVVTVAQARWFGLGRKEA